MRYIPGNFEFYWDRALPSCPGWLQIYDPLDSTPWVSVVTVICHLYFADIFYYKDRNKHKTVISCLEDKLLLNIEWNVNNVTECKLMINVIKFYYRCLSSKAYGLINDHLFWVFKLDLKGMNSYPSNMPTLLKYLLVCSRHLGCSTRLSMCHSCSLPLNQLVITENPCNVRCLSECEYIFILLLT